MIISMQSIWTAVVGISALALANPSQLTIDRILNDA